MSCAQGGESCSAKTVTAISAGGRADAWRTHRNLLASPLASSNRRSEEATAAPKLELVGWDVGLLQ